jgi:hypothetical protein
VAAADDDEYPKSNWTLLLLLVEGVRRLPCDCGSCPAAASRSAPGLLIFRPLEKGVQGGELGATAVLCAAVRRLLLRLGVVRSIGCCVEGGGGREGGEVVVAGGVQR